MLRKEVLLDSKSAQDVLEITIGHHDGSAVYGWMPDISWLPLPDGVWMPNYPCGSSNGIPYWGNPEDYVTCCAVVQMSGYTGSGISYGEKINCDITITCLETNSSIVISKAAAGDNYMQYFKRPDTFNINGSTVGQKRTFVFDPPPDGLIVLGGE